ncbi:hypothetical protein [Blastomonas sp.]|uniref:hypothetical protein n=1 Tax=Blastomonas sp. TaxID=1909299 RepID=UPI0026026EB6|nr:hypothetical protein [Blastomonas sp.]MDM7956932.1 hypothetical protein [Blastomonas sp.]
MAFQLFSEQHQALDDVARAILAHVSGLTDGKSVAGTDPLPALRLAFSRTVAAHCSAEIDYLREHVKSHPQVAIDRADLIRRFHDELLAWRAALMELNAHWPAKRVAQNPDDFLAVFAPLAEDLFARLRWEEQEFYPKVLGRGIA